MTLSQRLRIITGLSILTFWFLLLTLPAFTAVQIQSLNILAFDGKVKSEFLPSEKISIQAEVQNDTETDKIELIFAVYEPSGRKVYQHTGNYLSGKVGVEKSTVINVPIEKFYSSSGEYLLECYAKSSHSDATAKLKFNVISPVPEATVPVAPSVSIPVSPHVSTPPVSVEPIATEITLETTSQQIVEVSSVAVTPTILPSTAVPSAVLPVHEPLPAATTPASVSTSAVLPTILPSAPLPLLLPSFSELELYKELKKFIPEAINLQLRGYNFSRIKGIKAGEFAEIIEQLKRSEASIIFTDQQKKVPQQIPQTIVISKIGSPTILPKDTIKWLKLDLNHLIFLGDILRTDSKSYLGIACTNGTELKLNNSTEIAFLDFKTEELLIKLRYGEIWCKVFPAEISTLLNIQSSLATVITSHAVFNLELRDKLIVKVYDGEITLQTQKGKTTVQARHQCVVVVNKEPGEIEKIRKRTTWQEKLKRAPKRKLVLLVQLPEGKKKKIQLEFKIE
ncbi:MAG: FecR domain-containing protein [Elusimicrobiota bacterium]|nr:FecR domain-containing protein [Elusimicrobiota bacterium]